MHSPNRFVPTRAGIVNLYEYDDQVFDFAGGRLLLRGHNTSGKTKALELLLPFCLDGDISPRKLDPFAKSAKEMKWNLVGCAPHEQRIGYAWLEFARLGADGRHEHVTAGVGMRADRGRDGVRRWYFVLPGRRAGHDLELHRDGYPLPRAQLLASLGEDEELIDTPGEYRRRLNQVLYGFPSMEQYETMVNLMLELRRPHLSKGLDHRAVTRLLSASLPEVDHELMRRLGQGLEQLEELEAALGRLEQARDRVEAFHRSAYRTYARAALADRGERLRTAESGHERASGARRAAGVALEQASAAAAAIAAALRRAKVERDEAEGERDALVGSSEWASVAEVEQLGLTAGQAELAARSARGRHEDAAGRAAVDEAEAIAAGAAVCEAQSRSGELATGLEEAAGEAGLGARHRALAGQLEDSGRDPDQWAQLARDECDRRLAVLAEHAALLDGLDAAEAQLQRAREVGENAAARLRESTSRCQAFDDELAGVQEALAGAIETWAGDLQELPLDRAALDQVLDRALAAGSEGAESPQAVWAPAGGRVLEALMSERVRLDAARAALDGEREALAAERLKLVEERDEPPPAPHTRTARRSGRPGAPLWRLVDFADGLPSERRAGLEAALEGAGLLDAWVTPAGEALDPETLDVVLRPAGLGAGGSDPRPGGAAPPRSVAEEVVAVAGGGVAVEVVEAILASIALVEARPDGGLGCAISPAGHFRLGPAEGRFVKPRAEYVGAEARAARRRRRVAELDGELARVEQRTAALAAEGRRLEQRGERLATEQAGFPDLGPLGRLRHALLLAERHERQLRAEGAELEVVTFAAAEGRERARAACAQHAEGHALPPRLGRAELRRCEGAALRYRAEVPGAVAAARAMHAGQARLADVERRVADGRATLERLRGEAELAAAEARRRAAEHREREAALGARGEGLRARKQAAEARARSARAELERLSADDKGAGVMLGRAEDALAGADGALETSRERREEALAAFRRLEQSEMFVLALAGEAPGDHAEAAAWSLTRALEVLRAIPAEQLRVRSSLSQLANSVQRACGELDRSLSLLGDMSVLTQTDAEGLVVVKIADGARERTLVALLDALRAEVEERERTLTAEQRRVFNATLLEEIAEHLRARIGRVEELVADMNATLAGCPTGSGKTVALEWRPRDDDAGELRRVTRLLRRSVATLGEEERRPLVDFFRARIQQARDDTALGHHSAPGQGAGGAAEHLRGAFDYREWFDFDLVQVQDGQRERLTARRHAVGSGGEQAVLVHMPLFAAAAALYASSRDGRAPRLVMLDEALSGIDDETREKVMQVLVALDLDVVMTSHELWGTYRTVPSLAIYQLHRDNDLFGVAAEPFLWDGELLRELEQSTIG